MNKTYRFYLMNVMLYSMITLYNSYIPLRLSFLETDAKGVLLAISPVVSLFAPLLWGSLADRMSSRKRLLSVLCILSAIFFLAICLNTTYPLLFLSVLFYAFFSSSYGSLSDTLTIGYCSQHAIPYGRIRLMGTLGYGFFAVLSGMLMKLSPYSLPALYILLAVSIFFVFYSLPEKTHPRNTDTVHLPKPRLWASFGKIIKIPHLLPIIFFVFAIHYPLTYFYSFYSSYFIRELRNPEWYWGLLVLMTVLGEVPLLLVLDRLTKRFSIKAIFIASGIITLLRYTLLMLLQNVWLIAIVSLASGYVTTMTFYTATIYLSRHVSDRIRATSQSVLYSATALSGITANLIGGMFTKAYGVRGGMMAAVILAAGALICVIGCSFQKGASPEI